MATRPKPNWQRIVITVALLIPASLAADLVFSHLKHQALIWAHGGRWCADVDEVSGDIVEIHYGNAACDQGELEQV